MGWEANKRVHSFHVLCPFEVTKTVPVETNAHCNSQNFPPKILDVAQTSCAVAEVVDDGVVAVAADVVAVAEVEILRACGSCRPGQACRCIGVGIGYRDRCLLIRDERNLRC